MATAMERQSDIRGHRLMGGLAMAGAVCYIIGGFILLAAGDNSNFLANTLALVWALGSICGLVGIGMLGVLARGVFGRVALAIATLAYALVALDALLIVAGVFSSVEASPLSAISRLGTLVGMLLVGIAALVARRWPGWRKLSPFALLLALPLAIVVGIATGGIPIPVFIGLAWLIIGYAVFSTPDLA
ncbi:MAG TPA: hypothetical protein VFU22_02310 [Roseiflexaceae bacterium]|nr:hypothetical protein [Roseiflexaceae bacterium]